MRYIQGHIGSVEVDLRLISKNTRYYISSITNDKEQNDWKEISHVSRHFANGGLVKVKTMSGKKITTTLSHSHLKRTIDGVVPIKGQDLKIGDRIPVSKKMKLDEINSSLKFDGYELELTEELGWLFGAYLAERNINHNRINITNIDEKY